GEDEVLLLPARKFQVKSCLDSGNGLHIVQLEEMTPDYDLLEPVPVPDPVVIPKNDKHVKGQPKATEKTVTVKHGAGAMEEKFSTIQLKVNPKSQGQ
ncbi:unnamed protein product, partial [Rotaria sordida]